VTSIRVGPQAAAVAAGLSCGGKLNFGEIVLLAVVAPAGEALTRAAVVRNLFWMAVFVPG